MIINHSHKYLFIETPHTASTAVAKQLCEYHDGKSILYKHANYGYFKRKANKKEKEYFVFSTVRNPLDETVTRYVRYLNNHNSNYTDPNKLLENGGWITRRDIKIYNFVQQKQHDFGDFFQTFYKYPYTNHINNNKRYCNYIMRYENLKDEFSKVLKIIGIQEVKPLPMVNITKGKGCYLDYYDERLVEHAIKIFAPFIQEFKYTFPESWPEMSKNNVNKIQYELIKKIILYNSKYKEYGLLLKAIEKLRRNNQN